MCTVINNVKTSRRNSYTCLHPFTYWRQMRKSHSDAIEIALKKLVYLASIRLRGTEMAANRKRHSYCDVTTIRQTRHFRFWRRQTSRWRRRWFRQTEGDRFLPSTSFFQCMHPVRGDVVIMYTHRTTVLLLYSGLCDIRVLFMYDAGLHAWHIAPVRFNNVRLCPSIFISSISGLLRRPRVLNPARRLASLMR